MSGQVTSGALYIEYKRVCCKVPLRALSADGREVPGQIAQRANAVESECQKGSRDEIVREPLILWPDGLSEASIGARRDKAAIGSDTFQDKAMETRGRRQIGKMTQWSGDNALGMWAVSASWSDSYTIDVATSQSSIINAMAKISKSGVTGRK